MPKDNLAQRLLLPELEFEKWTVGEGPLVLLGRKTSDAEPCPHCGTVVKRVYDRRTVTLKDEPIRGQPCLLRVQKRRFKCDCGRVFTEPLQGVRKKARTTERFRHACVRACQVYESLSKVCQDYRCSAGYLYRSLYGHLRRKTKEQRRQVFPAVVGFDEHSFKQGPHGRTEFVTVVVNPVHKRQRLLEVVRGKTVHDLTSGLEEFEGSENVSTVVIDMSKAYKSFARAAFPNASLVADKFHVVRLLSNTVLKYRRQIVAKRTDKATRKLLLTSVHKLDYELKVALLSFLEGQEDLFTVWRYYQRILGLYRTRGHKRASKALTKITDDLAKEKLPELKTFRRTLLQWRKEILGYFKTRVTNARCEGFNNKAKVLKKRAYGFRSFENYRLRILSSCY